MNGNQSSAGVKVNCFHFQIMALRILREIAGNIKNALIYTIMADETADVSNKEQLVICIRWVDDDLVIHEDFIGMHPLKNTTADHIVSIIKVTGKVVVLLYSYFIIYNVSCTF